MFAKNIRYLRRKKKISQEELANQLGYKSFTTIQKWEDQTATPSYDVLLRLSDFFSVSVEDILQKDLTYEVKQVPILGIVRGGNPILVEQHILGYIPLEKGDPYSSEYFYLRVVGDSMKGDRILDNDLLYVKKQNTIEIGEIAVVLVGEEATVKRVYMSDSGIELRPSNELYSSLFYTNTEMEELPIQILGKVIHNKIQYDM